MVDYISSFIWSISLQIAILCAIILVIEKVAQNSSPQFKYILWCVIPLRLCIPVSIPFSTGIFHNIFHSTTTTVNEYALKMFKNGVSSAGADTGGSSADSVVAGTFSAIPFQKYLLVLWIGVIAFLLIRYVLRIVYMQKRIQSFTDVTNPSIHALFDRLKDALEVKRPVRIRIVENRDDFAPMVTGLFRPTILLPSYLTSNPDINKLEPILIHELIHVKKGDLWMNWIMSILRIVFFFHPAIWIAKQKLESLSEDVCDDLTILYTEGNRKTYFQGLLTVLERINKPQKAYPVEAYCMERQNSLSKRVIRLTQPNYTYYRPLSRYSIVSLVAIGLFSVMLSCESVVGLDDDPVELETDSNEEIVLRQDIRIYLGKLDDNTYTIDSKLVDAADLEVKLEERMYEKQSARLAVIVTEDFTSLDVMNLDLKAYHIGFKGIVHITEEQAAEYGY